MDFYAVLSVPRNATAEAIERAYLRLARRYHPGINPGDRVAADLFRQVREAYEVLGHLEQRREYDRGAVVPVRHEATVEATISFDGFDFATPAHGPVAATFSELFADVFQHHARNAAAPEHGASIELTLQVSFEDAIRGGSFPVSVLRQERCQTCSGDGRVPRPSIACPVCGGTAERRWARGHMVFSKPCDACDGTGRLSVEGCGTCRGIGVAPRSEVVTVPLPPGIESGARVAVPGKGHAGARGGPAGDLYIALEVAPHPFFRREGRDVHVTLPVAVHEAALGARVEVPTLDGVVKLRIPAGTSSGQRLRLRGHGVPSPVAPDGAGDLIAEVQLVLPPIRDGRSKELLQEFGRLNPSDVRRHLLEDRR